MKDFTLFVFVIVFVVIAMGTSCSHSVPQASAEVVKPVSQPESAPAPPCPKVEEVSKDYTDEDVVGFYFQGHLNQTMSGKWTDSGNIEVKRLQGLIEIDESYFETGKYDLRIMNNLKHGGKSGFGAILPDKLQITLCGKVMNRTELFPLVDQRRMVVKGAFKRIGEGEGTQYIWQKLDICHIE